MRIAPECLVCSQRQAVEAARRVSADDALTREILSAVGRAMFELPETTTPAAATSIAHRIVRRMLGVADPYREAKSRHNAVARELYPALRALVDGAEDRLVTALKVAVVGNLIDLGVYSDVASITDQIWAGLRQDFVIDECAAFSEALDRARRIVFIGDNAGEIGFDRVLVEEIGPERVTFVVRESPVLNDATYEDAVEVGLDGVVRIITTGDDSAGVDLSRCSAELLEAYAEADLIVSKGQGNFESLDGRPEPIFFLLQAKCAAVSGVLGVPLQSLVLMRAASCAC